MTSQSASRRYDLDWLRVLAFAGVFLYHCSRFFDDSDWHIKNAQTSAALSDVQGIFETWGMPLVFIVSGASIFFALHPGQEQRFRRDKVNRLVIPWLLGVLVLGPLQIYLDWLTHGRFQGSFFEFLPVYFGDWYKFDGAFAWSGVHLWYLANLFVFISVLLPLFSWLKTPPGLRFLDRLARWSERPGRIYLWTLPPTLLIVLLDPFGITRQPLPESLLRLLIFWPFVIYGFLIYADERIRQAIMRQRRVSLAAAVIMTLAAPLLAEAPSLESSYLLFTGFMLLAGLMAWTTMMAILGYAMRYLTAGSARLAYANEAVLPFYILHQPVILLIGFFIIPLDLPIAAKYLIITPAAFITTMTLYEFGVRRLAPLRTLFGMRKTVPPQSHLKAQAR